MGIDLTVAPVRADGNWKLCCERLRLDRDYRLFHQLMDMGGDYDRPNIKAHRVPKSWQVDWYGDGGIAKVTADQYGSPLTYLLRDEWQAIRWPSDVSDWNLAVKAFLAKLPDDYRLILWWH